MKRLKQLNVILIIAGILGLIVLLISFYKILGLLPIILLIWFFIMAIKKVNNAIIVHAEHNISASPYDYARESINDNLPHKQAKNVSVKDIK